MLSGNTTSNENQSTVRMSLNSQIIHSFLNAAAMMDSNDAAMTAAMMDSSAQAKPQK